MIGIYFIEGSKVHFSLGKFQIVFILMVQLLIKDTIDVIRLSIDSFIKTIYHTILKKKRLIYKVRYIST